MLTGSVASSAHGKPRSTRDIDIVIAPTVEQLRLLIRQFPDTEYYADEQQALQALENSSLFNVIDFSTGWKVDFIVANRTEFAREAFSRRKRLDIAGNRVYVSSSEDVVISKMEWAKLTGGSDRQLQDAADILVGQSGRLDVAYVEHWVSELGLEKEWSQVQKKSI